MRRAVRVLSLVLVTVAIVAIPALLAIQRPSGTAPAPTALCASGDVPSAEDNSTVGIVVGPAPGGNCR